MVNKKSMRKRGKVSLSRQFQEFKKGDFVAVAKEPAVEFHFPKNLQGRTGTIEEKKGKVYLVKIKTYVKEKNFLIEPIHLKKINLSKNK